MRAAQALNAVRARRQLFSSVPRESQGLLALLHRETTRARPDFAVLLGEDLPGGLRHCSTTLLAGRVAAIFTTILRLLDLVGRLVLRVQGLNYICTQATFAARCRSALRARLAS